MSTENLLDSDKDAVFGVRSPSAVIRETVVAAIFEPDSKKYLCQYWKDYDGLTCLLSGGIEPQESRLSALKREIAEETGYTDFEIVGVLGGSIKSYYKKRTTGENFVKHITAYLVVLNSLIQKPLNREKDEKFENFLKSPEEIIEMMEQYEQKTGSPLGDHKEILCRAQKYLNVN